MASSLIAIAVIMSALVSVASAGNRGYCCPTRPVLLVQANGNVQTCSHRTDCVEAGTTTTTTTTLAPTTPNPAAAITTTTTVAPAGRRKRSNSHSGEGATREGARCVKGQCCTGTKTIVTVCTCPCGSTCAYVGVTNVPLACTTQAQCPPHFNCVNGRCCNLLCGSKKSASRSSGRG